MVPFVYGTLFTTVVCYAYLLERTHDRYTPDWTWLTVVIGNFFIGLALGGLCWLGELPAAAFWHLVGLNVTAGSVIIIWQLDQSRRRHKEQ